MEDAELAIWVDVPATVALLDAVRVDATLLDCHPETLVFDDGSRRRSDVVSFAERHFDTGQFVTIDRDEPVQIVERTESGTYLVTTRVERAEKRGRRSVADGPLIVREVPVEHLFRMQHPS